MASSKDEEGEIQLLPGFTEVAIPKGIIDELKQGEGRVVFTSSKGTESSYIMADGSMSIYTYHLANALKGEASNSGDLVVKISNLMTHLGNEVPKAVRFQYGKQQTPYFDFETEDFAIALLKGGKGFNEKPDNSLEEVPRGNQETNNINIRINGNVNSSPITIGNNNSVNNKS